MKFRLILIAVGFVSAAHGAAPVATQQRAEFVRVAGRTTLAVESARPVGEAVAALADQYGYLMTYEDPKYTYSDDLQDVTAAVRKDLASYRRLDDAPKVIIPAGGKLSVDVTSPRDGLEIANRLVEANVSTGGRFRVVQDSAYIHIVPSQIRDRGGKWVASKSILDAPISLPSKERTQGALLREICAAVGAASRTKVALGGVYSIIVGFPERRTIRLGAQNEPARAVLTRALMAFSPSADRFSWVLYFDPGFGNSGADYVLNPFVVHGTGHATVTLSPPPAVPQPQINPFQVPGNSPPPLPASNPK